MPSQRSATSSTRSVEGEEDENKDDDDDDDDDGDDEEEGDDEDSDKDDGEADDDDAGPMARVRTLRLPLMVMGTLTCTEVGAVLFLRLRFVGGARISWS